MNQVNFNKVKESLLPLSVLVICAILYLIWPTAHTIALRKLILVIAAGLGFVLWIKSDDRYFILISPWLIFLGLLLIWVVFHAGFLSQNGSEAWREFWGQWFPAYLAIIAGIGLALAGRKFNSEIFITYLLVVMAVQPVLFIFNSVYRSIELGHLATDFYIGMLGTDLKTSLTFSSDMLAALSCAKIIESYNANVKCKNNYRWWMTIVLAILVAIFASSTNSILLIVTCVILTLTLLGFKLKIRLSLSRILAVAIALILITYSASMNISIANKWQRMIGNAKVALDVDTYPNWINDQVYGLPKNELGEQLSHSFYMRVAWSVIGPQLVLENPWGYGVTRKAFERLVQKKYPEASIANAHNSYLNLSSAVGIPGLLFFVFALVAIFRQLHKSNSEYAGPAMWMIGIYAVHWATDALERDHFFESYLFVIAFLMTLTMNKIPQKFHD